jgi:hypothetical protein
LLGDGAYPISEFMMTPFRFPGASAIKNRYNTAFSATRVLIENAFGLLKGRWGQLRYLRFLSVEKISLFIKACCVLHNICIDRRDHWESDDEDEEEENSDTDDEELLNPVLPVIPRLSNRAKRLLGEQKRNRISNNL